MTRKDAQQRVTHSAKMGHFTAVLFPARVRARVEIVRAAPETARQMAGEMRFAAWRQIVRANKISILMTPRAVQRNVETPAARV